LNLAVSLDKICKSFREGSASRRVLSELSMQVESGETVALLGASGSGKSTLLNIVSGLTSVDSGRAEVTGVDLTALGPEERTKFRREKIGFVFQFFHLIPTLTVEENLRLPLQLNEKDDEANRARARSLLKRVGLESRADTFPDRLSGGEQQRVAVCRALSHDPPLILADEPTGNLDGETAVEVLNLILELAKENNSTLMIVTHSREVAARCERTFELSEGRFLDQRLSV
jgi:putative ABC transport system ATP-binding protein